MEPLWSPVVATEGNQKSRKAGFFDRTHYEPKRAVGMEPLMELSGRDSVSQSRVVDPGTARDLPLSQLLDAFVRGYRGQPQDR